jgi:hypothetical protein
MSLETGEAFTTSFGLVSREGSLVAWYAFVLASIAQHHDANQNRKAKTVVAPLDRVKILFQASNPDFQKYAGEHVLAMLRSLH